MKRRLKNTLFDKSRFEWMEKENVKRLRKLTIKCASKMQEDILNFCEPLIKNFEKDNPVSYEILLKK